MLITKKTAELIRLLDQAGRWPVSLGSSFTEQDVEDALKVQRIQKSLTYTVDRVNASAGGWIELQLVCQP